MLEEDEELHHEIVNHDVYTHTVSSIEEDVAFRHSTVEQDVRRWHHEHELPVRRSSRSRSKKKSSHKSAKSKPPAKSKPHAKWTEKKNFTTWRSKNYNGRWLTF